MQPRPQTQTQTPPQLATKASPLYWGLLSHGGWQMHVAADDQGLAFVGSQAAPIEELQAWAAARRPASPLVRDDERLSPYIAQLCSYLDGACTAFTIPLSLRGTPFQEEVWQALREVPYGQTASYSDIATRIRRPAAVRAVGAAIGANPVLITIPCHRVIGKRGALTGYRGGLDMKAKLLELEGISQ